MFSFLQSTTVTLLAREVQFDASNPQNPIVIEGDRKGFFVWVMKKLRLIDPSFRLEVKDNLIVTRAGKKKYQYLPTSLLSGYSVGFSMKKLLIVNAMLIAAVGLLASVSSFAELYRYDAFEAIKAALVSLIVPGGLAALFYWLYKRSGALTFSLKLYNGEGTVNIRIQSGLTGLKLDKELLEQAIDAAATASKKSTYFN